MLPSVFDDNRKAPFSLANWLRCKGECYTFPWITPLYPWHIPYNAVLSKEASRTIFWVFDMIRPGIEPRSPEPLANTLYLSISLLFLDFFYLLALMCSFFFLLFSFYHLFFLSLYRFFFLLAFCLSFFFPYLQASLVSVRWIFFSIDNISPLVFFCLFISSFSFFYTFISLLSILLNVSLHFFLSFFLSFFNLYIHLSIFINIYLEGTPIL